jgi:hypothetical protein
VRTPRSSGPEEESDSLLPEAQQTSGYSEINTVPGDVRLAVAIDAAKFLLGK